MRKFAHLFQEVLHDHQSAIYPIVLIDGMNLFIRNFSANPTTNMNGDHVGGVVGFIKSLGKIINDFNPDRCIIVFDGVDGTAQRKKIFSNYKQGRAFQRKMNRAASITMTHDEEKQAMRQEFVLLNEYLALMPFSVLQIDRVECDDVIATLAKSYEEKGNHIVIISNDRDFFQLISEKIQVHRPSDNQTFDEEGFKKMTGIIPKNYIYFKALAGDKSDAIPGIKGVSDKDFGSAKFRQMLPLLYGNKPITFDELKENIASKAATNPLMKKIIDDWEIVERNFKLMSLDNSITGRMQLKSIRLDESQTPIFNKLEFRKKIIEDSLHHHIINLDTIVKHFSKLSHT